MKAEPNEPPCGFISRFIHWWKSPIEAQERINAAYLGGFGFFCIAVIIRLIIGPLPVSYKEVGIWAFSGMFIGAVLGPLFPRFITCLCFPFLIFTLIT